MHFFDEKLAHEIGLSEAIFLQNLYYLAKTYILRDMKTDKDDVWIKLSTATIQKFQSYFSRSMIRTLTKNLLEEELIKKVQMNKSTTNAFSYSLTNRGWILMMALDSKVEIKKLKSVAEEFSSSKTSKMVLGFLKSAEKLKSRENIFSILSENSETLENSVETKVVQKSIELIKTLEVEQSEEIAEIILESSTFKKRVERTFSAVENYKNLCLIPAIEKHGYSNVIIALKKTVQHFTAPFSPVANFYCNLNCTDS
ncbi:hypothetical protein [Cetobacterium sp.]|uniref:hypothetical protein n=1 Tax=Cetobacterium sp. TaxID=2071632 RepID=UPI003F369CE3